MSGNKAPTVDSRLTEGLSGMEKIRTLMKKRSGSVSRWAVDQGFIPEQVWMCTSGVRTYPEIRDRIAADFDIPREEVDALLDPAPAAATA